ncbi:N-acetyltransferase [Solimonas sp. K1W22B-7]|uniref:GNAT family N-acetyltransferase n=1 Tax=Solimonas sp. K1W22B-7 TaxID=2303331 RepID=UPI000E32E483|nr:GNAT family protein [Solimonas sp. K1W22B-7]AXQ29012.1 N-acetyltransferase [Solimonas sp. K1W22B-7]
MKLDPVTLAGRHVRLEPLGLQHIDALAEAGTDPAIWTWYPQSAQGPERTRAWVQQALDWQANGLVLPFAQIDAASGRVIGSTRFAAIEAAHRRAEIGWTWLTPAFQRTAVNTESKYLMLRHAFETLGLIRVEFKTDSGNQASRRALARIGATEEGIFRNHMIMESGRLRHSVYFSIIDSDWPAVKAGLERKLA